MSRPSKFSSRTMRMSDWPTIRHFGVAEFKAPEMMGYEFMLWLDKVRFEAQVEMPISSSYRSPSYNKSVGGAADSSHTDDICNAVDIARTPSTNDPNWNYSRWKIIEAAIRLGCRRIGLYPSGSLHLDRTEDVRPAPRLWVKVDNPA
ncbi:MAG TPA: D-Ala-D-Ala carboxypeptidase family metallohydrolase [Gemmatimonadaceae bacterium]|nr:D-Ala-D-Ala carboxypeptidase family metallohydrolase [Gemmatimonadaceae bacterium]